MKNCVLLIIVFINVIHCSDLNISDDSFSTCLFTLFRRKREAEYTRWRANLESTPEFIVKVLDEDLSTPRIKKVIAVNLPPPNIGGDNIIVGGVMVPEPTATTLQLTETTKDYTRFMPPTTPAAAVNDKYHTAKMITEPDRIMKPRGRHPQRDESPPAGPQFLPRAQSSATWQYAPITPVGFTRRTTIAPITPSSDLYGVQLKLTRTTPLPIKAPTRTTIEDEELRMYHQTEYQSFSPTTVGTTTAADEQFSTDFDTTKAFINMKTQKETSDVDDTHTTTERKMVIDENDMVYQMTFYNDDDDQKKGKNIDEVVTTEEGTSGEVTNDEVSNDEVTNEEGTNDVDTNEEAITDAIAGERNSDQNAKFYDIYSRRSNQERNENAKELKSRNFTVEEPMTEIVPMLEIRRPTTCSMVNIRQLSFNAPRTLPEIVHQMKQWAESSPIAKWVDITGGNLTTMENPIYMMIVDDPSSGQIVSAKQTVMIVAGMQGRDHHAVSSAMYVLYQLIERSDAHGDLLSKYRFWIIPVFNPDGYEYSMTFPHRREWTKNLRQNWDVCTGRESCVSCANFGLRCTVQSCYGVNLDRNFEYQWIPSDVLRSEYPCGSLYPGTRQLSEVETQALTTFLHDINTPVFTFIAFKEGDVLGVMYPYSHTKKRRALDGVYRQRAARAAGAAYSISGRSYVAGQTSEFLPLYAGGIEDWVDSHMGIDNTYTIVMYRPSDTYNSKLITERVVHEAYAAMDTLVLQSGSEASAQPQIAVLKTATASATGTKPSKLHFISIYFTLLYLILDILSCKLS